MDPNNRPEFSPDVLKLLLANSSNLQQQNTTPQSSDTPIAEETVQQKHNQLVELSNDKIEVQRPDGQASYISASSWEDLQFKGDLLKGIYQKGFSKPSKIQAAALPLIVSNQANLIAQAKNGSGKTATFALCMLSKINPSNTNPQAICLTPTRELTLQIAKVIGELGQFTSTSIFLSVPQSLQYDYKRGGQIVVGTPGKTQDLLKRRSFPTQDIVMFVLDEADEMINMRNKMSSQVQQIRQFLQNNVQMLFFSATFSSEVAQFADSLVPNAHKITVKTEELSLSSVSQFYMICNNFDHKLQTLSDLYSSMVIGQSVIFVKSRMDAFKLANEMMKAGHAVSLICGTQSSGPDKMDHTLRDQIMSEFRSGVTRVLICTDLLSRGIDVPQVTLVINFDMPIEFSGRSQFGQSNISMETYLHRVGRTGRFGLKGIAINFILPNEMNYIQSISSFYQFEIKELKNDLEEIERMVSSLRS